MCRVKCELKRTAGGSSPRNTRIGTERDGLLDHEIHETHEKPPAGKWETYRYRWPGSLLKVRQAGTSSNRLFRVFRVFRGHQKSEHRVAQETGQRVWYSDYQLRVARVERDYGTDAAPLQKPTK